VELSARIVAQVLYLFAPLLVSATLSGAVMRFDWFPALRRPIDHGATWSGRRIFGDGKTWRGVVVAVAGSIATVSVQSTLGGSCPPWLQVVDYRSINPISFGGSMGFGAMLGELPNSFVKRRLDIPRGQTARGWLAILFYVWDQVDLLIGTWPLLRIWFTPSAALIASSFVVALTVHPLVALIGYLIGARPSPR
jgi:CDP-archaeol synthase